MEPSHASSTSRTLFAGSALQSSVSLDSPGFLGAVPQNSACVSWPDKKEVTCQSRVGKGGEAERGEWERPLPSVSTATLAPRWWRCPGARTKSSLRSSQAPWRAGPSGPRLCLRTAFCTAPKAAPRLPSPANGREAGAASSRSRRARAAPYRLACSWRSWLRLRLLNLASRVQSREGATPTRYRRPTRAARKARGFPARCSRGRASPPRLCRPRRKKRRGR